VLGAGRGVQRRQGQVRVRGGRGRGSGKEKKNDSTKHQADSTTHKILKRYKRAEG
jgi:hypothetical protein